MKDNHRLAAALLAGCILVAYAFVLQCGFLNLDDDRLVLTNPHVTSGVTSESVAWAFTDAYESNWVPLSWISHMAIWQVFGTRAWGHHLVNVLLHVINALLLFALLRRLTGSTWASFFAAGLFGVHPVHVESVAWIAELRDVLSTAFWLLVCHAYIGYVQRGTIGRYVLVAVLLALGLLAKATLVTLPCVLLLLDYWPLRRLRLPGLGRAAAGLAAPDLGQEENPAPLVRCLLEKLPLLGIVAGVSALTVMAQGGGGAVKPLTMFDIPTRISNAIYSYAVYLYKVVVPVHLPIFEPHPRYTFTDPPVVIAILVLAALAATCAWQIRRRPYLMVGLLWYVGVLVPVIGLIQVGGQGRAYRYVYVPLIGLYLVIATALPPLCRRLSLSPRKAGAIGGAVMALLMVLTALHVRHWRDNETIYHYTLGCTRRNNVAHNNLAVHYNNSGRYEEAIPHLEQALEIWPRYPAALRQMGRAYTALRRYDEAVPYRRRLAQLKPDDRVAQYDLGTTLINAKRPAEAVPSLEAALKLAPDDTRTRYFLANAYQAASNATGVLEMLEGDLDLDDEEQITRIVMQGAAHRVLGEYEKAAEVLAAGLNDFPDDPAILELLGFIEYSHLRRRDKAYEYMVRLLQVQPEEEQRADIKKAVEYLKRRLGK